MNKQELFLYWFDNNIYVFYVYDCDNHESLKAKNSNYVDGKIYFDLMLEGIFNEGTATNPLNVYDRETFWQHCPREWVRRLEVYADNERTAFGPFYVPGLSWKVAMQG